jgi:hypothetical protein
MRKSMRRVVLRASHDHGRLTSIESALRAARATVSRCSPRAIPRSEVPLARRDRARGLIGRGPRRSRGRGRLARRKRSGLSRLDPLPGRRARAVPLNPGCRLIDG